MIDFGHWPFLDRGAPCPEIHNHDPVGVARFAFISCAVVMDPGLRAARGPGMTVSQRSATRFVEGAGCPFPFSFSPEREMERREAPGVCETPSPPFAIRAARAPKQDGVAKPIPGRARPAVAGLRGPPPGRCASRRSTAGSLSETRLPLAPLRLMSARRSIQECRECKGGFRGVRNFFQAAPADPSQRTGLTCAPPSAPIWRHSRQADM
jgi:hypothetical protein